MSNADMSALHRNFERRVVPVTPVVSNPSQVVAVIDPRVDQLLARMAEQNQLITRMVENFQKLISSVTVPQMPSKDDLVAGTVHPIIIQEYALDTARTNEELNSIQGNIILAVTDGDLAGIAVRLNERQSALNYFDEHNPIEAPFFKLFLTSNAQSGKTLKLIIGANGLVNLHESPLSVTTKQKFRIISSDSDVDFIASLAQYQGITAALLGLATNKVRITGISALSSQPLHYRLVLISGSTPSSGGGLLPASGVSSVIDFDTPCVIGSIDLDIATAGYQRDGVWFYFMDLQDLDIDYVCQNEDYQLTVYLQNLSVTAKKNGANSSLLGAIAEDGGVQTDETSAANNATANDMTLLPAAPAVNDTYYFGADGVFNAIALTIGQPGVGVWTLTWEFYAEGGWTSLTFLTGFVDGTNGFRQSGVVELGAWRSMKKTTVNGIDAFWVRARVSAFTSCATQPLGTIAYIQGQIFQVSFTYESRQ